MPEKRQMGSWPAGKTFLVGALLAAGCGSPPTREEVAGALYLVAEGVERLATSAPPPDPEKEQRAVEVRDENGSAAWAFSGSGDERNFGRGRAIFSGFSPKGDNRGSLLVGYVDVVRPSAGALTFATERVETIGAPAVRLAMSGMVVLWEPGSVTLTGTVKANESDDKDDWVFASESFSAP